MRLYRRYYVCTTLCLWLFCTCVCVWCATHKYTFIYWSRQAHTQELTATMISHPQLAKHSTRANVTLFHSASPRPPKAVRWVNKSTIYTLFAEVSQPSLDRVRYCGFLVTVCVHYGEHSSLLLLLTRSARHPTATTFHLWWRHGFKKTKTKHCAILCVCWNILLFINNFNVPVMDIWQHFTIHQE